MTPPRSAPAPSNTAPAATTRLIVTARIDAVRPAAAVPTTWPATVMATSNGTAAVAVPPSRASRPKYSSKARNPTSTDDSTTPRRSTVSCDTSPTPARSIPA
ncbi:hypothetical protein HYG77_13800 [Rhodococcus sp. ZPP]|uniref:hypothetical protein n=1 Tax=Rhodococcus sp. ZPP TaxID=2749906 RepID=UPI001AD855B9|nr:hypothetical protein [Rhodococcus sp. ZPP]QTJ66558.1 hypothetical protein HYG77_13800 [Rhodococcus sp. ZPP]